jgi:signal transduction histidine kinase
MRERAELMGGAISFSTPASGGTLLQLTVPRQRIEALASEVASVIKQAVTKQ